MHAIRLHTFGPAENLTYEKVTDPAPAPGQVRIAVAAAGRLTPAVHRFPLAEAAHRTLENRGTTGKVVLEP